MADPIIYEQKIKDMQKYIPFLENLIKKMKNNKDEKKESHLNKVEMLYGLLTNKDKKLKLETLQKCEAVLIKLCEKIEKTDLPSTGFPGTETDDVRAPASPSNPESHVEPHNPIVIPTERRPTPPPPSGSNYSLSGRASGPPKTSDDNSLFDRARPRTSGTTGEEHSDHHRRESGSSHTTPQSGGKTSPELFKRRSPNRDRPNRYDEELRKKYESPQTGSVYNAQTSSKYSTNYNYPTTPRPRVQVRSSFNSEVLKSPPLTLDDLKDLMDTPEAQQSKNAPILHHKSPFPPQPVPPPYQAPTIPPLPILDPPPQPVKPPASLTPPAPVLPPRSDPRKDVRPDPRADPRNMFRSTGNVADQMTNLRMDPRATPRIDPRLNREAITTKPPLVPPLMSDHTDPKPVEPPVRLAYKYNPHPRRETPISKQSDFDTQLKVDEGRGVNHLPSVNPSDPRLRNRQMSLFGPECPPTPMSHMNSPIANMPSPGSNPLSPMANQHSDNSPIYGNNQQFFGKFPQHMPSAIMHNQSMYMGSSANPFKQPSAQPTSQQTPRTYGEYRKFKKTFEQKKRPPTNADSKSNSSYHGQSPLETTVKPMEFTKAPAPSVLDTMYRNPNFKPEAASAGVQSFKIPKLNKGQPPVKKDNNQKAGNQNKVNDKADNWDDNGDNWDNGEDNPDATNQKTTSKTNESTKNDKNEDNWDDEEIIKPAAKRVQSKSDDNWDDEETVAKEPVKTTTSKSDDNWDDDGKINEPAKTPKSKPKSKRYSDDDDWEGQNPAPRKKTESKSSKGKKQYKRYSDDEDWEIPELSKSAKSKKPVKTSKNNLEDIQSDESFEDTNNWDDGRVYDSISSEESESGTKIKVKKTATKSSPASTKKPTKADSMKPDSSNKSNASEADEDEINAADAKTDESAEDMAAKTQNQKKRKCQTDSKKPLPEKVAKTDENDTADKIDNDEGDISTKSVIEKPPNDDDAYKEGEDAKNDGDEEPPDTIINSDISMKNIIEGRRRTRVSNRNYSGFDITPPKQQQPTATTPTKTPPVTTPEKSPTVITSEKTPTVTTPAKTPTVTTPAAKTTKQKSPVKILDEASEECAVSSTTTIVEPQAEEEPQEKVQPAKTVARGKGKKGPATKKVAKKASSIQKETTEEPKEKPKTDTVDTNPPAVASTSTATKEKDEITKEWLESFLLNLFNPSQMSTTSVLAMLEKVLDTNKFQQVKQILCSENTQPSQKETSSTPEPPQPNEASTEPNKDDAPKAAAKPTKKKKNELDRLNEDIRDMFICQGVLTATGRRMCTAISEKGHEFPIESDRDDESIGTSSTISKPKTTVKKTKKSKASKQAAANKKGTKKKIRRRGLFWKGEKKKKGKGRGRPRKSVTEAEEGPDNYDDGYEMDHGMDVDDEHDNDEENENYNVLPEDKKSDDNEVDGEEELLKIVVGKKTTEKEITKKNEESIEILDSSTEDTDLDSPVKNPPAKTDGKETQSGILIVDQNDFRIPNTKSVDAPVLTPVKNIQRTTGSSPEDGEAPSLEPVVLLKRGKGRLNKAKQALSFDEEDKVVDTTTNVAKMENIIRNINSDMHYKSEHATVCAICQVSVRHIANHFVQEHPNSEVLVSRLPPKTQEKVMNENGIKIHNTLRLAKKTVYRCICPFCEISNAFTRMGWVDHFGTHTGEYNFKCSGCNRMFNLMSETKRHISSKCPNAEAIRVRGTLAIGKTVPVHICSLCNYLQLSFEKIQSHLQTQHEIKDDGLIKQIVLLHLSSAPETNTLPGQIEQHPTAEVTDAEKNREVFVSNEQNDINLDTNIIQFMRDVSFSATGSPPRQATMSVADRINERLKNVTTHSTSDHSESDSSFLNTPQKSKSMADRLSERFNRTSPPRDEPSNSEKILVEAPSVQIEMQGQQKEKLTNVTPESSTPSSSDRPIEIQSQSSVSSNQNEVQSIPIDEENEKDDSDDDVIIISDGEEESKTGKQQKANTKQSEAENLTNNESESATEKKTESPEITEILDDDDDWEDIETPPSPSCLESESRGLPADNKMKKNKTIYATLSRLYASIVQPKSKDKSGEVSDKESTESSSDQNSKMENVDGTKCSNDPKSRVGTVDKKKSEVNGMQRVDNLGFVQKKDDDWKYHCLIEGCSFLYSDMMDGLRCHIALTHSTQLWSGFCHTCKGNVKVAEHLSLKDELDHLQEAHIKCPKRPSDIPVDALRASPSTVSTLKLRRLSGDQLSAQNQLIKNSSPTHLQITSAVSLNKDSNIWKTMAGTPEKQQSGILVIKPAQFGSPQVLTSSPASSPPVMSSNLKITNVTSIAKAVPTPITPSPLATKKISNIIANPASPNLLRPWLDNITIKSEAAVKSLLKPISLYAKFKCMGNECDYATGKIEKFFAHIEYHHKQNLFYKNYLACCYCDKLGAAKGESALTTHIKEEHSGDLYQCPYCFYRSCEATNVVTHLEKYHSEEKRQIFVCQDELRDTYKEFQKVRTYLGRHIESIRCADCPQSFVSPAKFVVHLNEHYPDPNFPGYKCGHCKPPQNIINRNCALLHLEAEHKISIFACVYCKYEVREVQVMMEHLADQHASKPMLACIRSDDLDSQMQEKFFAEIKPSLQVVHLKNLVDKSLFVQCPYTTEDLSNLGILWNPVPNTMFQPKPSTQNISIDSSEKSPAIEPETENRRASTEASTSFEQSSPDGGNVDRATQILNVAKEICQKTGISSETLYQCGAENCDFKGFNGFKSHLTIGHDPPFKCFHCEMMFKTPAECLTHYHKHERHRYFCFICFATSPSAAALAMHISKVHAFKGKSTVVTYALIKGHCHPKNDFFFVCPSTVKAVDVVRFGDRLLKMWERKKWSQMKKSFTPDEIDQLPRQAIFFDELYCATCQYRTKVRTNLYRHLLFHKHEVNVANIDPVNPVPCLNSNEKHFDKMTNLACSSHANKPPPPATTGPGTSGGALLPSLTSDASPDGILRRIERVIPEFVASKDRYICEIGDCNYGSTTEIQFKQHLNLVHANVKNYSCPHCNVIVCTNKICADKVAHHMKFHDTNLFQCKRCGYLHFNKSVMEKHLSEKHPNDNVTYFIYTRDENLVNQTSSQSRYNREKAAESNFAGNPATYGPSMKWQCTLCKAKTANITLMSTHLLTVHNIKYRYQCSNCKFGAVMIASIREHAQRKHPKKMTEVICFYKKIDEISLEAASQSADTTPLWRRDPDKVKNIRGILMEEESVSSIPVASTSDAAFDDDDDIIEMDESLSDDAEVVEQPTNKRRRLRLCRVCSYSTPDLPTLHAHIAGNHVEEPEHKDLLNILFKFYCFHCEKDFKTMIAFKMHWDETHKIKADASVNDTNTEREGQSPWFTVSRRLKCSKCYVTDNYRELAIHHFLDHPGKNFATRDLLNEKKCGHCEFQYDNDPELDKHYRTEHPIARKEPNKGHVPDAPYTPLTEEFVRQLAPQSTSLQYFKCNICNAVLNDMNSWNLHSERVHGIKENMPCTVLQGMMYKCPCCRFCSPLETTILKHITNKLKSNNFDVHTKIMRPPGMDEKEWPYAMLQVIFPNGFVSEKFRLFGTRYGNMNNITAHVRKTETVVIFEMTVMPDAPQDKAVESKETKTDITDDSSKDSSKDDDKKATTSEIKTRPAKRPASKDSNIVCDTKESEEDSKKPIKKFKQADSVDCQDDLKKKSILPTFDEVIPSSHNDSAISDKKKSNLDVSVKEEIKVKQNESLETKETKKLDLDTSVDITNSKNENPGTSSNSLGTTSDLSLANIIANVIVDGVKVMIPASDFHKIFKKQLTLKLQKVKVDSNTNSITPSGSDNSENTESMSNNDEKSTQSNTKTKIKEVNGRTSRRMK